MVVEGVVVEEGVAAVLPKEAALPMPPHQTRRRGGCEGTPALLWAIVLSPPPPPPSPPSPPPAPPPPPPPNPPRHNPSAGARIRASHRRFAEQKASTCSARVVLRREAEAEGQEAQGHNETREHTHGPGRRLEGWVKVGAGWAEDCYCRRRWRGQQRRRWACTGIGLSPPVVWDAHRLATASIELARKLAAELERPGVVECERDTCCWLPCCWLPCSWLPCCWLAWRECDWLAC